MRETILALIVVSFVLSWLLTFTIKRIAPRLGFVDKPGGRKTHANPKPLGGGVAIFSAFALPMIALLLLAHAEVIPLTIWTGWTGLTNPSQVQGPDSRAFEAYLSGVRDKTSLALTILGAAFVLH